MNGNIMSFVLVFDNVAVVDVGLGRGDTGRPMTAGTPRPQR